MRMLDRSLYAEKNPCLKALGPIGADPEREHRVRQHAARVQAFLQKKHKQPGGRRENTRPVWVLELARRFDSARDLDAMMGWAPGTAHYIARRGSRRDGISARFEDLMSACDWDRVNQVRLGRLRAA